jgi:hypothetical protein
MDAEAEGDRTVLVLYCVSANPLEFQMSTPASSFHISLRKLRVLNDLQMTRLYGGRMIRLLAHPPPHHPSASCLSFSDFLCAAGRAY